MIEPYVAGDLHGLAVDRQTALGGHAWTRGVVAQAGGTEVEQARQRRPGSLVQHWRQRVGYLQIERKAFASHLRCMP
ncbi:MAG: hypothetical protein AW07_00532 [Candidatus Accumulibacter sp. SK-11]|nr:MAG: hypothetical protein AW07_00532 [Candidatus Accumulibacter sp. SK-11]